MLFRSADKENWEGTQRIPSEGELFDSMSRNLPSLQVKLAAHRDMLTASGVPIFAVYEAGQSLIASNHPWRATAIAAQRSESMGLLYTRIRETLQQGGVHLANWYSAATSQTPSDPRVDVFGLLETTLDKAGPLPKAIAAKGG